MSILPMPSGGLWDRMRKRADSMPPRPRQPEPPGLLDWLRQRNPQMPFRPSGMPSFQHRLGNPSSQFGKPIMGSLAPNGPPTPGKFGDWFTQQFPDWNNPKYDKYRTDKTIPIAPPDWRQKTEEFARKYPNFRKDHKGPLNIPIGPDPNRLGNENRQKFAPRTPGPIIKGPGNFKFPWSGEKPEKNMGHNERRQRQQFPFPVGPNPDRWATLHQKSDPNRLIVM